MLVEKRTAVRVILVDSNDRVLMLGARDPDDGLRIWFLPGGGIEGAEGLEDAARRELREELSLDPAPALEGPVWQREHRFTWDGHEILQREWFLVARVTEPIDPKAIRIPDREGDYFIGAHWLSVDQLSQWPDRIAPRRLVELLPPILAGDHPQQPMDTGT